MPAPTVPEVITYLGTDNRANEDDVTGALAAEKAAQGRACRVPADDAVWPPDLAEALCRRVAHNLAVRSVALGVEITASEMAIGSTRVGGRDPEVARLEAPFRRLVIG